MNFDDQPLPTSALKNYALIFEEDKKNDEGLSKNVDDMEDSLIEINEDEEGYSNSLTFFKEKDEVFALFRELWDSGRQKGLVIEERSRKILEEYQEQPQLLAPFIPSLLELLSPRLIAALPQEGQVQSQKIMDDFHAASRMIRLLCKVRGTKHVAKYLPHEVWQFEPCLTLLLQQEQVRDSSGKTHTMNENWESVYVLFLWLGTLCLVPFDILSMDSSVQFSTYTSQYYLQNNASVSTENNTIGGSSQLAEQIVAISLRYLYDSSPVHEASSQCLAQLITRPDMTKKRLEGLISQCTTVLSEWKVFFAQCIKEYREMSQTDNDDLLPPPPVGKEYRLYIGTLKTLNYIFKRGHREKLWFFIDDLLPLCLELERFASLVLERKLLCKLVQRLGLLLLPPREAKWRYQRGHRTLNIESNQSSAVDAVQPPVSQSEVSTATEVETAPKSDQVVPDFMFDNISNDENQEVHEYVEHILHLLLIFLSDKDTVVRWSAAKGIGRITMRLPQSHGNDITEALLSNFNNNFNSNNNSSGGEDSLWHGGCLALAELARRGLLLPNKLDKVIPLICEASRFDLLKGQYGVGAHVRDASSYVWWAFARAYSPAVMRPFILDISLTLLTVTLFDREINCRRASSAALQENIGRLGYKNFSNGLNIITIADYFSVSNRNNTYLVLAPKIALLDQIYHSNFITHLVQYKLDHWDKEIRILAAKSLARLILLEGKFSGEKNFSDFDMLELLLSNCLSDNISLRHGSLLASGYVLRSLSLRGIELPPKIIEIIENVVPNIEKKRLYRGRGSELIREAVCILIENIALAELKLTVKGSVSLVEVLNEQLKQPFLNIQLAAQKSLRQFLYVYFGNKLFAHTVPTDRLLNITTNFYLKNLVKQENVAITRGYLLALGVLPPRLLLTTSNYVISSTAAASPTPYSTEVLDKVYETLDTYSNNNKKISGEYDAESCKNAIISLIELTEKLSFLPQFSEKYWTLTYNILLRALNDYSIDKRGDTGSWSRIASLKGLERIIYSYNRRKIFYDSYSLNQEEDQNYLGRFLLTRYGIGRINKIKDIINDGEEKEFHIEIFFFKQSLGESLSENDIWLTESNLFEMTLKESHLKSIIFDCYLNHIQKDLIQFDLTNSDNLPLTLPYDNPFITASNIDGTPLYSVALLTIQEIFKQAAEKLDSVREVAGNVLERLLKVTEHKDDDELLLLNSYDIKTDKKKIDKDNEENDEDQIEIEEIVESQDFSDLNSSLLTPSLYYSKYSEKVLNSYHFLIPEKKLIVSIFNNILNKKAGNEKAQNSQEHLIVNWNNSTNFCYEFLSNFLLQTDSSYFYSIFLGLIVSIGGLTETISKYSSMNLLNNIKNLKKTNKISYNVLVKKLFFTINHILVSHKKNDRVVLPLFKVLDLFYKNSILNLDLNDFINHSEENYVDNLNFLVFYNKSLMYNSLNELKLCKNITKIFYLIDFLCHLSSYMILLVEFCQNLPGPEGSVQPSNPGSDNIYKIVLKNYYDSNDVNSWQLTKLSSNCSESDEEIIKNHPGYLRRESIRQITRLLLHKYPRVRKYAAEALYLFLLSDSLTAPNPPLSPIDLSSSTPTSPSYLFLTIPLILQGYLSTSDSLYNETHDILTLTTWDLPEKEILMESRNKMFNYLSFPIEEVATSSSTKSKEKNTRDELDSYEALVRQAGY